MDYLFSNNESNNNIVSYSCGCNGCHGCKGCNSTCMGDCFNACKGCGQDCYGACKGMSGF